MKKRRICSLCGEETSDRAETEVFICSKCTAYFAMHPERAKIVYDKLEDEFKRDLLKKFLPEEENDRGEPEGRKFGQRIAIGGKKTNRKIKQREMRR